MTAHQQAEGRVQTRFWIHLLSYVAVVGGLAILNLQRDPDNLWVLWVAGGWGIGILAHAFAFTTEGGRTRMISRVEERMDRREARQERREERFKDRHDVTHMTDKMSEASH